MTIEDELNNLGFQQDKISPLKKYYLNGPLKHYGPKYRIMLEERYFHGSNKIGWDVSIWNCESDTSGNITKRIQAGLFNNFEDIKNCIKISKIELNGI